MKLVRFGHSCKSCPRPNTKRRSAFLCYTDNNLLLGAVLGDGGFSVVQKGFIRDKTDKTESDDNEGVVAVKRIPFAPESLPRNIRMLQHKVSIKLEPYYERKLKYHGEAYLLKEKIKSKCSLMGRSIA